MHRHHDYEIDDDRERLDLDVIWTFLSTEAYWSRWRTRADVEAQIRHAWRVVGAYAPTGELVGFARAWSDGGSGAYLGDVFVVAAHRGQGVGVAVVGEMVERGPGAHLRWLLHTADAHGLYRRFGFAPPDRNYLERPRRPVVEDDWEREVADIWGAAADLTEDEVVARIEAVAARRPHTAEARFERASAYDFVGREADAEPLYRDALAAGLDDRRHPRAVIQLASTLRNLGRADEALELLAEPLSDTFADARAAFTTLALLDAGRDRDAARTALDALATRLPVYGRAVTSYIGEVRSSDS